jgi:hypothetical protein
MELHHKGTQEYKEVILPIITTRIIILLMEGMHQEIITHLIIRFFMDLLSNNNL